jgi:hypothetical protein
MFGIIAAELETIVAVSYEKWCGHETLRLSDQNARAA